MDEDDRWPTVLIVCADEDSRVAIRAALESAAIHVVAAAEDGFEAVRLAGSHRPTLVSVDEHLDLLDTASAVREMRRASPQTLVVALTEPGADPPPWADAAVDASRIEELVEFAQGLPRPKPVPKRYIQGPAAGD